MKVLFFIRQPMPKAFNDMEWLIIWKYLPLIGDEGIQRLEGENRQ
jgi:hypothetical protein